MTSGHALLKILSGFALAAFSILFFWKILIIFPILIIVIITALEMLIAFLQTYVLVTLVLIYTGEQE
jgi:F0F1-type ATP synthase membrane subunit a